VQPADRPVKQGPDNRLARGILIQFVEVSLNDGGGVFLTHGSKSSAERGAAPSWRKGQETGGYDRQDVRDNELHVNLTNGAVSSFILLPALFEGRAARSTHVLECLDKSYYALISTLV
jgi:hypothetical protein